MGWSMDSWEWAKSVVGEVRHGVGVGPGTDGIDFSDASRPTPIFSCRVFHFFVFASPLVRVLPVLSVVQQEKSSKGRRSLPKLR